MHQALKRKGMTKLLLWPLGKMPQTADILEVAGWRFEIVDMDNKRIDKVLASKLPTPSDEMDPEQFTG